MREQKNNTAPCGQSRHPAPPSTEGSDTAHVRPTPAQADGATNVEIILRPERYSRQNLGGRILGSVKRLASLSGIREAVGVFKLHALDDRVEKYEWIDLLRDQFVTSRRVLKLPGRQRGVDSAAMFQIINEEVYGELRDELGRAAGVET